MIVTYSITARHADSGVIVTLTHQDPPLACPAVGSFFETIQPGQSLSGTVLTAATIIEDHPQQQSGDIARRHIIHSVVLGT